MTNYAMHLRPGGQAHPNWSQGINEALDTNSIFIGWQNLTLYSRMPQEEISHQLNNTVDHTNYGNAFYQINTFCNTLQNGDAVFCFGLDGNLYACRVIGDVLRRNSSNFQTVHSRKVEWFSRNPIPNPPITPQAYQHTIVPIQNQGYNAALDEIIARIQAG